MTGFQLLECIVCEHQWPVEDEEVDDALRLPCPDCGDVKIVHLRDAYDYELEEHGLS